jgi:LemA protein
MKISRKIIIRIILVSLLVIIVLNAWFAHNKMVTLEEAAIGQWTQVENVYQRRSDLIPNIVSVAKKYGEFEKGTLEAVINARAKATQITISPEKLDEASLQKFENAQNGVSSALGRLLMVSENYPDLKTSEKFNALITELEGSENRIARERQVFNEFTKNYNAYIRKFPATFWAGIFGFERRAAFKMKEGADIAPDVDSLLDK